LRPIDFLKEHLQAGGVFKNGAKMIFCCRQAKRLPIFEKQCPPHWLFYPRHVAFLENQIPL
jgi:hypothetical protein